MTTALLYAATVLTGGFVWFATRLQVATAVHADVSLVYRFGLSAAGLLGIAAATRSRVRFGPGVHLRALLLGALIFAGSFTLIYEASRNLTSGLVALAFSSVVLMNVVNGAVFLGQAVRVRAVLGGVLGIGGLLLVFWPEVVGFGVHPGRTIALLQAFGAAGLFSLGNIVSAKLHEAGVPVLTSTGLAMMYGAALLALKALGLDHPFTIDWSGAYLGSLAYLTVFGSVVGYATYFAVIGRVGPGRAAYAMLLVPLLAMTVSIIAEGVPLTARMGLGAGLVLAGSAVALAGRHTAAGGPSRPPAARRPAEARGAGSIR